ncbi:MAG: hypothetical protein J0H67_02465 [Rhodospirillales bacterium]|nr:hypothetical protein [Rhodospirillales bacterium]MBN8898164.1 hypothetical protein [Rhodospirillales bacterium]
MHVASGTIRVTFGAGDCDTCRTDVPHCVENRDATAPAPIDLVPARG